MASNMAPISRLPTEVLVQIFSLLPTTDLVVCAEVCGQWNAVTQAKSLQDRMAIAIQSDEQLGEVLKSIARAGQPLGRAQIRLKAICVSYTPTAWDGVLQNLTELSLSQVDVSAKDLTLMLLQCGQLRELELVQLREALLPGNLLEEAEVVSTLSKVLAGVWRLNLEENQYLTDALFNRILAIVPNITHLSLRNCKIMNHSGIYKKFYPPGGSEAASPSVFTFRNVLAQLEKGKRSALMKSLDFYNAALDGLAVQDLANLKNLELEHLNLGKCTMVTQEAILELVRKQPKIQTLGLDFCRRVFIDYPATSLLIFQEMPAIRELSLRGLSLPKGFDAMLINADALRVLRCCDMDVSGIALAKGITGSKSATTMKTFSINNFVTEPENLATIFSHLRILTKVELRNCQTGVTDHVLQIICQNLGLLRHLDIMSCRRLTDVGFIPARLEDLEAIEKKEQAREGDSPTNIFLGSKAEREIVASAQKSVETTALVNTLQAESASDAEGGIHKLTFLNYLDISGIKLSDVSLKLSFVFKDLRFVDVSQCSELSDEGFRLLGEKNPHLEIIKAKQCNISDGGLEALIKCTKRLRELDLESCRNISSRALNSIARHCKHLQCLNVSYCGKLKVRAVEKLQEKLPALRSVACLGLHITECFLEDTDEEEECMFDQIKPFSPPVPPPPPPPK